MAPLYRLSRRDFLKASGLTAMSMTRLPERPLRSARKRL